MSSKRTSYLTRITFRVATENLFSSGFGILAPSLMRWLVVLARIPTSVRIAIPLIVVAAMSIVATTVIVEVLPLPVVLIATTVTSTTMMMVKRVEGENDWRRLLLLLAKISKDFVSFREAILELLFEFLHQGDFRGIQLKIVAIAVVAWKIQVNFTIGISHGPVSI